VGKRSTGPIAQDRSSKEPAVTRTQVTTKKNVLRTLPIKKTNEGPVGKVRGKKGNRCWEGEKVGGRPVEKVLRWGYVAGKRMGDSH